MTKKINVKDEVIKNVSDLNEIKAKVKKVINEVLHKSAEAEDVVKNKIAMATLIYLCTSHAAELMLRLHAQTHEFDVIEDNWMKACRKQFSNTRKLLVIQGVIDDEETEQNLQDLLGKAFNNLHKDEGNN